MLDDLRKAIITGALAPDTVEGDRLACLAFNLNMDSQSRLCFTKLLHAFHQYLLLQSSGRAAYDARRARRVVVGLDIHGTTIEHPLSVYNELLPRSDEYKKIISLDIELKRGC